METGKVTSIEDGKAHYIIQIFKHFSGLKVNQNGHYVLGIYGKAPKLVSSIRLKAPTSSLSKKVVIESIDEHTSAERLSAIIVTKQNIKLIVKINKQFPHPLIITDGQVERAHQIVSLIKNRGQLRIKINHENLLTRGFKISNSMLDFAGDREDLNSKLREQEGYLETLLLNSQEQEKKLLTLNHQQQLSHDKLSKIEIELNEKTVQLQKSEEQLRQEHSQLQQLQHQQQSAQEVINANKVSINAQKILIKEKQKYLEQQKSELLALTKNVISTKAQLKKQLEELTKQNKIIADKEKTITGQKLLLSIIGTFTLVAIILIYFVYYLYKSRKQANEDLTILNEQLYEQATTDGMTKLFNRRHFIESAQAQEKQLKRKKSAYIVLMIDIDHFKNINDSLGHAMGDAAIIYIANILKENLREYDIVGRLGGEEFAMMLPECKLKMAINIAERLRKRIADSEVVFQNNTIQITVSIGLAPFHSKDKNIHQVLHRADVALYQAKESGRNKVVVNQKQDD